MEKKVYVPNADVVEVLKGADRPMSFGEIAAAMLARTGNVFKGTATITAMVKHNIAYVAEVRDVTCPHCGKVTKNVKFYSLVK